MPLVLGLVFACRPDPEPEPPDDASPVGDDDDDDSAAPTTSDTAAETASTADTATTPVPTAADWILDHFATAPALTGAFTERTDVETPALVHDATACCAKYAFDLEAAEDPDVREVGFVNVTITELVSTDAYGGGIQSGYAPGAVLFLANVTVDPGWPLWESYDTTNYDGLVLDDAAAIYGEDVRIEDWNADGGIDNKATVSQFVRLTLAGHGNRGLRYWSTGPHYLVASALENTGDLGEGTVLWFYDCDATTVYVYDSTFGGSPTVEPGQYSCDNGTTPQFVYLTVDPRTTGEMHEMFNGPS